MRRQNCRIKIRGVILFLMLWIEGCIAPGIFFEEYSAENLRKRLAFPDIPVQTDSSFNNFTPCSKIQKKITIPAAIENVLKHSPILQQVNAEYRAAIADRFSAFSLFLPQVSGTYAYDSSSRAPAIIVDIPGILPGPASEKKFQRLEVDVKMILWDFGRTLGQYKQAIFAEEIAYLTVLQKRQEVVYSVLEAYFSLLNAQKQRAVVLQSLETARAHRKLAQSFYDQEVVDKNDLLKAELQVAELEQQLLKSDHAVEIYTAHLNKQMGLPVLHSLEIEDCLNLPRISFDLKESLEMTIRQRPEFQIIQKNIRLAEAGYTSTWANHLPVIYVAGKYQWSNNDFQKYLGNSQMHSDNWVGEIGIQIDLFSGGRHSAQIQKAESKIVQAIGKAREVCDWIALEVKSSVLAFHEAKESIGIAQRSIVQAEENLRLINNKYKSNLVTSTDVIEAETLVLKAKQNYYSAVYRCWIAFAQLLKATGRPVEEQKSLFHCNVKGES